MPSIRGLATMAGVSVTTLLHYFTDRGTLWSEVLGLYGQIGREIYLPLTRKAGPDFEESIRDLSMFLCGGFQGALASLHSAGLREAFDDPRAGVCYLETLLEPTLAAIEERLAAHQQAGQMRPGDVRLAALQILAPIFLAALHQMRLGGCGIRPLDLTELARTNAADFCRSWVAPPPRRTNNTRVLKRPCLSRGAKLK